MLNIPESATNGDNSCLRWFKAQRWHTVRLLQLAFGAFCLGDFLFFSHEWAVLTLGSILFFQGVFDWQLGCASGRCPSRH